MRQLAERYVCDRGRLVVECLSCGKRKEDAAEESNPAGCGSAFLVPRGDKRKIDRLAGNLR